MRSAIIGIRYFVILADIAQDDLNMDNIDSLDYMGGTFLEVSNEIYLV